MLDATARSLEALTEVEWDGGRAKPGRTVADAVAPASRGARPIPTRPRPRPRSCIGSARPSSAGSTIPNLTPARVAQAEGISERYLQKLFEGVGDNFTRYVRERRLQRAWADLSNPTEAHRSISEIAYRYGFGDSAHFSRTFRASLRIVAARVPATGSRARAAARRQRRDNAAGRRMRSRAAPHQPSGIARRDVNAADR